MDGQVRALFTLKGETVAHAMEHPSDRTAIVGRAAEAVGGKLEAYYWMLGERDGFVIVDMPDSTATAALSLAVGSTGAFGHVATHELFDATEINELLARAKGIKAQYPPP